MSRASRRALGVPARPQHRGAGVLSVAVAAVLAVLLPLTMADSPSAGTTRVGTGAGTAGLAGRADLPTPLLWSRSFADPTVVLSRVGYVGAATAPNLNLGRAPADSGPWDVTVTPALTRRPNWATSGDIWAPDIQRAPGGWLMYYAAPIAGYDANSRCIGVAHAKAATGPYTPVGNAPLVCPVVPGVPRAGDTPPSTLRGAPVRGVIDPSAFVGNHGQRYLVYRTQGQPSSIRLVRLAPRGRRILAGQTSRVLTVNSGIEENPVIIRHGEKWVMFTSLGWFGHCGYRTAWRRSPDLKDWSRAKPKLLLSATSGLCGPGGLDVVQTKDGREQAFFHAWTCYRGPYPCPSDWNKDHPKKRHGVRALYGANLGWTVAGRPLIIGWIGPILPPPPTPTPTPTPSVTPSPTPTITGSPTPTTTDSPTVTPTISPTVSPSGTVTGTVTGTATP